MSATEYTQAGSFLEPSWCTYLLIHAVTDVDLLKQSLDLKEWINDYIT